MFKVECVGCQAPYQVDERRVPDKGLKMRCPKCGTTFKVEPPAAGVEPSPTAAGEGEELLTAGAASQPFSSGGAELGAKLNKPPSARDSLARTMIGVSSGDLAAANKDAAADPNKPKAFRIPRPTAPTPEPAPAPARVRAPVTEPLLAEEIGLPATPAQARAGLGLTSRGAAEPDAALPRPASEPRRPAVAEPAPAAVAAPAQANDAPAPEEVQHVLPSVAPVGDVSWLAGEAVVDAPSLRPAGTARAPTAQARPAATASPTTASATASKTKAATPDAASPGVEPLDNLPAVPPVKRPPPRRPRPAADAAPESRAELPARPEALDPQDTGLPAVVASPPRQAGKAPRQPAPQKPGAAGAAGELDLPAFAPRPDPLAARAPAAAPEPSVAALVDLPSLPARPAPELSEPDLPSVGRGLLGSAVVRPAAAHADLPSVPRGAGGAGPRAELPDVRGARAPATSREAPSSGAGRAPLPDVFATELPAVSAGLPAVPGGGGLPAVARADLPSVGGTGLPSVGGTGLPAVRAAGLPAVGGAGLPAVAAAGLPAVSAPGLPDVLPVDLPSVSAAGLPDVLATGLPTVTTPGLPEVTARGVAGFGRVDLPVARPAELPEVRAQHLGLDTVDLPGVGENLPSMPESWGEANLPLVGENLPSPVGAGLPRSIADVESPFGADEDPFGGPADFGAPDGDDPFGDPSGVGGEFAPAPADDVFGATTKRRHDVEGAGYGEVDIGGAEGEPSPLETADDMEFHAIPERSSTGPARASASPSVHADAPDTDATGSTLELGPERKAPRARKRRLAVVAALCLGTIAGGALALKPALGPFGVTFIMDQIKRGERERLLAKLVADARAAERRDTLDALRDVLRDLEKARAEAPRFAPLAARSALEHYAAVLRFGPLPELEATAKMATDQLDPVAGDAAARLARAAQSAAARSADAKQKLEALGTDADARALLGELCLRQQDWPGAGNVWTGLSKSDADSARAVFGLARVEFGLRRYPEALAAAQRVLALNPEHVGAPILMLEAQRALRQQDPTASEVTPTEDLAATVTRKLSVAAPGEAALAHCVLGELRASQGRMQPAQQEFEAALVIDRTLPRALIGLGEALSLAGRHSEALARFEAAAKAQPSLLSAQLGIAKSQLQLARLNEAKAVLQRLPEADKAQPDAILWTAKVDQALNQTDAALAGYRAAIAAGKGSAESVGAYLALAKLQSEIGQLAAAQATLTEAHDKLPPSGALHKALGDIALTRAEYAPALEHFQKALELDPGDTRARFLTAVALTRLGRFDEAMQAFQSVVQTDKDFPGLAVERGRLFEVSGRNAEALAEYEGALKQTPDDPDVQVRVGCARVSTGQAPAAQSVLEAALKQRPRSAEASYCLGRAYFEREAFGEALTRFERAIDIDPTRAIYHLYAGWVATEMSRQGDARKSLDKALELDKGLGDAYWLRGRLLLKQGAAKDAILDLERAAELAPQRQDTVADLAVAYADIGRLPKALDLWEQALGRDPDNATWHFRYGKLLSTSGNGQMAAAHLKRALEIVREAEAAAPAGAEKPKPPVWIWQAHYLLARELGRIPAAVPHWQEYLRLSPHDDPYRGEAERALRDLGQPWSPRR